MKTLYQFQALQSFKWWKGDFLVGEYKPGLTYNVREGNTELHEKVQEWANEDPPKVQVIGVPTGPTIEGGN